MKKSLLFSGVAVTKFSKSFSNNELSQSFPRSPHCIMLLSVLVQQAGSFCYLIRSWKETFTATFYALPRFITVLKLPVTEIIKIVMVNMNPKFTKDTLSYLCHGHFLHLSCKGICGNWNLGQFAEQDLIFMD